MYRWKLTDAKKGPEKRPRKLTATAAAMMLGTLVFKSERRFNRLGLVSTYSQKTICNPRQITAYRNIIRRSPSRYVGSESNSLPRKAPPEKPAGIYPICATSPFRTSTRYSTIQPKCSKSSQPGYTITTRGVGSRTTRCNSGTQEEKEKQAQKPDVRGQDHISHLPQRRFGVRLLPPSSAQRCRCRHMICLLYTSPSPRD